MALLRGLLGFTDLFSLKNVNAQRAIEKVKQSFGTSNDVVGCYALYRGLLVNHISLVQLYESPK